MKLNVKVHPAVEEVLNKKAKKKKVLKKGKKPTLKLNFDKEIQPYKSVYFRR